MRVLIAFVVQAHASHTVDKRSSLRADELVDELVDQFASKLVSKFLDLVLETWPIYDADMDSMGLSTLGTALMPGRDFRLIRGLRTHPLFAHVQEYTKPRTFRSYSNSISDTYLKPVDLRMGMPSRQMLSRSGRRQILTSTVSGCTALIMIPALAETTDTPAPSSKVYDVPSSVRNKRILITGANTGLGLESAKRLARAGAKVVLTARTRQKAASAVAAIKTLEPKADVIGLVLDLARLQSIKSFHERYNAVLGNAPLDVLVANAGIMAVPERLTTVDGLEKQVGVNHLGHFALVAEMIPELQKATNGFRIIMVSSDNHKFANEDSMRSALDQNLDPSNYSQWGAYGISKAANILFAKELQRRFDDAGIHASAVALNPGGVRTDLLRYLIQGTEAVESGVPLQETYEKMDPKTARKFQRAGIPVEQGANTQVYLAAAADSNGDLSKNGGNYFYNMEVALPSAFVNNQELAKKLWEVSEKLTGTKIPI
eukprot:gnl/MRDRNA2_/MRDRNA2_51684_c0_seq1.p1 gnl/MRDRNA2_/MRDRNA2_51684_c0~~gnl/MRDRNA2_/MRDRNA2_51684_c0_seq1.p1  ORF type:complete len:487 (+),score=66.70 gnl/MRDRNA2_/MRDRNA2_51684_c0_seq1:91-1551(+)